MYVHVCDVYVHVCDVYVHVSDVCVHVCDVYGTRIKKVNVLRAYYAYGYGRTWSKATGVLGLRLRAYYAYGYGRIAATTTGVLQAYTMGLRPGVS